MELSLLQTTSSQDRELESDPSGLTFHSGSSLKTKPGEDQAGLPVLTTVVGHSPASAGWHSAGGFRAKTGLSGSGLKTSPGIDQSGLSTLVIAVKPSKWDPCC